MTVDAMTRMADLSFEVRDATTAELRATRKSGNAPKGVSMEHLLLKAAVTAATDQGTFEAVISAASIDREKDIVDPAGMVRALQKWGNTNKKIPLAWNHSTAPEHQIGYVDPASARAVGDEVWAKGWIDQSTEAGGHAWRLVKAGTLGFSFGYLTLDSQPRRGGGKHIKELDVFEVTATPTPMNNDTRVVGWKSLPSMEEQRKNAERVAREVEEGHIPAIADLETKPERKGASTVGPAARHHLEGLIKYYMGKPHPFGSCVEDNTKRFGVDGADRVCATLKDIGAGTTRWRNGGDHGKAIPEPDMGAMCQSLYDAAGGDLEALLDMWHAYMDANGDNPEDAMAPSTGKAAMQALRRRADANALEFVSGEQRPRSEVERDAMRVEMDELRDEVTGYKSQLADSQAELEKAREALEVKALDAKTLRRAADSLALEHATAGHKATPVDTPDTEDEDDPAELLGGMISTAQDFIDDEDDPDDVARMRQVMTLLLELQGAESQEPKAVQSNLSSNVKDTPRRVPDNHKSVDVTGKEHASARPVDPLRRLADAVALDFASDGESRRKPPHQKAAPKPQPQLTPQELKQRMREETLIALTGDTQP